MSDAPTLLPTLILASQSASRRAMLTDAGVPFTPMAAMVDEDSAKQALADLSPRDLSGVTPEGVRQVMAGRYTVSVGSGQPGTGVPVRSATFDAKASAPLPK